MALTAASVRADGSQSPSELARLPMRAGAAQLAVARALRCPREVDVAKGVWAHVSERAVADPRSVAVNQSTGSLSYQALWWRVRQFQAVLLAHGCEAGDRVCVTGPRCGDMIAAYLAIESLDAVYVPIHPDGPSTQLLEILRHTRPRCVLVLSEEQAESTAAVRAFAGMDVVVAAAPGEAAEVAPVRGIRGRSPEDARYVIHTSGTTGRPKGAVVVQQGLMNHLWALVDELNLTEADTIAFCAPTSYVVSIAQMLAPLLVGATVAVFDEADTRFGRRVVARAESAGVTVIELVPTVVGWVVREACRRVPARILPDVRCLLSGGETLRPDLAARVLESLPNVEVRNAYGATECSNDVTLHRVRPADVAMARIPLGRPIPNAVVYLLVCEDGWWRAAEPGEPGELWVGGLPVSAGYLDEPGLTRAAFFVDEFDPASPTGRLYRTGDIAVVENGQLYCLGRADRQVKVAGARVELDGVEAALNRLHGVIESAVVAAESGTGESRLTAYYVADPGVTEKDLFARLRESLPSAAVPRRWIRRDALPRNNNGKIDRRRLGP